MLYIGESAEKILCQYIHASLFLFPECISPLVLGVRANYYQIGWMGASGYSCFRHKTMGDACWSCREVCRLWQSCNPCWWCCSPFSSCWWFWLVVIFKCDSAILPCWVLYYASEVQMYKKYVLSDFFSQEWTLVFRMHIIWLGNCVYF